MAKPPKKAVNTAKAMYDAHWKADSTNLSNAVSKAKELISKYDNPNLLMGGTKPSNEWQAAKDSLSAIGKRRQGDSKFWEKMSK
jgi:hypothetical protein